MVENYPVKIDDAGRVVIPNKIRNECGIRPGSKIILNFDNNSIIFRKIDSSIDYIIGKIKKIEMMYNGINFLLSNDKEICYASESLKDINRINPSHKHYYCDIKDDIYTNLRLKVICNNKKDESIAKVICELFSTL